MEVGIHMSNGIIDLRQAVSSMWETAIVNKNELKQEALPYVFIVGAGISMPEIIGSSGIVNHCKNMIDNLYAGNHEVLDAIKNEATKLEERPDLIYSYWFEQAYKNKYHRQKYLEKIIGEAKLSSGNLLLAQILNSRKIATTVITPNFDDQLLQALYLMGDYKVYVANNVLDNVALMTDTNQIQIIHVHGTYKFYDCCNLEDEVLKVSQEKGIKSTANAIDDFLKMHAPIVIGYSGWEQDVIMTRIKERLQYDLPFNMFWFCYTQEDYESLPDWLKKSEDVRFIVPFTKEDKSDELKIIEKKCLPAKDVFSAIISKFEIPLPSLLSNPIDYILQLTQFVLPSDESIFPIKTWKQRLNHMEEHMTNVERYIIEIEEAAAKKSIIELTEKMKDMDISIISKEDLNYILFKVIMPLMELENRIEEQEDIFNFCQLLIDIMYKRIQDVEGNELKKCLRLLLGIIEESNWEGNELKLLERIKELTDSRTGYDDITLCTLGMISEYASEEKRKSIQKEIVERGKGQIADSKIARIVLIALCEKILLEKKLDKEEKNLIDSIYSKNVEVDNIIALYFYYILLFLEMNINIYENIEDIIKKIKESNYKCQNQNLIRAIYIEGKTYENQVEMLNLYENSLQNYKYEKFVLCFDCIAFICMIYKIVTVKIERNEYVDRKYIDMIIDLSEKESGCEIISENIAIILGKYSDYIQNIEESKEILEKCILICDESKMYRRWFFYCNKYMKIINEAEKKIFIEKNKKYKEGLLAEELLNNAVEEYRKLRKRECLGQLLDSSEIYDNYFGDNYNPAITNIAYMVRRGEAPEIEIEAIDLLNKVTWDERDVFLCINKYLCYWKENLYEQALNELIHMDIHQLEDALEWWMDDLIVENEERYCVLFGLVITGFDVSDSINIYEKKFWNDCLEYVNMPQDYVSFIEKLLGLSVIKKEDTQMKLQRN